MPAYKAIIFDFDDTLIDFPASESNALRQGMISGGLRLNVDENWPLIRNTYEPISARYWGNRAAHGLTRQQIIEHSIRDTLIELNEDGHLATGIADRYWDAFCTTAYPNPGAEEILQSLHGRFILGLVTNGYTEAQRGRLEAANWAVFFQAVVISDDAGVAKPNPRIFEIAIQELDVRMEESLYVGDSLTHDLAGATSAGMDFCLYRPQGDNPINDDIKPTYVIKDLMALETILTPNQ